MLRVLMCSARPLLYGLGIWNWAARVSSLAIADNQPTGAVDAGGYQLIVRRYLPVKQARPRDTKAGRLFLGWLEQPYNLEVEIISHQIGSISWASQVEAKCWLLVPLTIGLEPEGLYASSTYAAVGA